MEFIEKVLANDMQYLTGKIFRPNVRFMYLLFGLAADGKPYVTLVNKNFYVANLYILNNTFAKIKFTKLNRFETKHL